MFGSEWQNAFFTTFLHQSKLTKMPKEKQQFSNRSCTRRHGSSVQFRIIIIIKWNAFWVVLYILFRDPRADNNILNFIWLVKFDGTLGYKVFEAFLVVDDGTYFGEFCVWHSTVWVLYASSNRHVYTCFKYLFNLNSICVWLLLLNLSNCLNSIFMFQNAISRTPK